MLYRDADVLRKLYHDDGLTMPEMADELDCSVSSIHKWMDKHDIDRDPHPSEQPLSISYDPDWGYELFQCNDGTGVKTFRHHRLLAYRGHDLSELDGKHVHHKNGIPWDNRPDNLQLIEPGDHAKHHHTGKSAENDHLRKISEEQTKEVISTYHDADTTYAELADEYGLSEGHVGRLIRNA